MIFSIFDDFTSLAKILIVLTFGMAKALPSIGYEDAPVYPIKPKLISESVQLNEVPTKIIKITKTVAVKVPVPYPVKIPISVPVPVPVNRPIAFPVPHIVKVPNHIPVAVVKPVPIELTQQVPLYVPQPIIHSSPYDYHHHHHHHHQQHHHDHHPHYPHDIHAGLYTSSSDFEGGKEATEQDDIHQLHRNQHQQHFAASQRLSYEFQPSQPDYANPN